MKSLFYGSAVAAMSGLLMGAGFKTPLAVEDFQPTTAEAFVLAEPEIAQAAYQPEYLRPIATPASYSWPTDGQAEMGAALRPAVYTAEAGAEAPTPAPEAFEPVADRTFAPERTAPAVIASNDAVGSEAPFEQSQGFYLLEEAPDPS